MPLPRAMRYTSAVIHGTNTRNRIHTALSQPFSVWSRKTSMMMYTSTNRYAMYAKIQK